ncbi:protein of unknown function [Blastococcus saxobsidens DD2]|uniref:Uncharacterized protein n=1 Tax=Blastococcus saxobsidens (strain DD2) TaxID=1146883 RepID=H6RP42_BLASD|nr:protein of unknown function [Blastococcus saxobsidens DD2]
MSEQSTASRPPGRRGDPEESLIGARLKQEPNYSEYLTIPIIVRMHSSTGQQRVGRRHRPALGGVRYVRRRWCQDFL